MNEQNEISDHVGQKITKVPKPAAVLDVAKIRKHCSSMLEAAHSLGVGFRAHVKTHKTIEVTSLQIGDSKEDAKLIVSTVAELEHLLPLLERYMRDGRRISVLYGIPLPPSQVPRLAKIARRLGPESIVFMIDHPSQLGALRLFHKKAGFAAGVYIKVDTGYHRAGLPAASLNKGNLVQEIFHLEEQNEAYLVGLYSHSSLSYGGDKPVDAFDSLTSEIKGCLEAMQELRKHYKGNRVISVSVGASPQAITLQNLVNNGLSADVLNAAAELKSLLEAFSSGDVGGIAASLEIHAGVYSILDLQQLSTKSKESFQGYEEEIALTVAAEVVSVYNDHERYQPEVLIAVGTLGLGREPCQGYHGWGVVSTQNTPSLLGSERRLVVDRISQEHAILAWEMAEGEDPAFMPPIPLDVGQTVFVYPNHACVTGAMYKSYLVVDSSREDGRGRVIDNWKRCSGW
ncbi:putative serine dehydratase domain-containing protein [Dactylonectria macrodidyma]|uniref:Serine dehydratase domain-containing protein n=1 Tax=Dactylonectria macrodidyma TaxID=307937 RepID=A0A9P9JJ98_9HYPO|nr:putative serine dehydratase domain-containing protein [Dactylonectria macrodidyma]